MVGQLHFGDRNMKNKPCHVKIKEKLFSKDEDEKFSYSAKMFDLARKKLGMNELKELEKEIKNMEANIIKDQPGLTPYRVGELIVKKRLESAREEAHAEKVRVYDTILKQREIENININDDYSAKQAQRRIGGVGYDINVKENQGFKTRQDLSTVAEAFQAMNSHALLEQLAKVNGRKILDDVKTSGQVAQQIMDVEKHGAEFSKDNVGKVARIVKESNDLLIKQLRIAGFTVKELEGRVAGQVNNIEKILAPKNLRLKTLLSEITPFYSGDSLPEQARELWKQFVRPTVDVPATFPYIDATSEEEIDKALDDHYSGIVNRSLNPSEGRGDKYQVRSSSLANSIGKHERKLFHKTGEGFVKYQQQYGAGTLFDAIMADIKRTGFKIAVMNEFGIDAKANYEFQKDLLVKNNVPSSNLHKTIRSMDSMFDVAMGNMQGSHNNMLNRVASNFMAYMNTIKLGGVLLRVTNDLSNQYGFFQSEYGTSMADTAKINIDSLIMTAKTSLDRKVILDSLNVVCKSDIGATNAFGNDMSSLTGHITRANLLEFKINGLRNWDGGMDHGTEVASSKILGGYAEAGLEYNKLPDKIQRILFGYGFTDKEWNLWKNHTKQIEGLGHFMSAQAWRDVSDKELTELTGYNSKSMLAKARQDLEIKSTTFFHDQYKYVVPGLKFAQKAEMQRLIQSSPWGMIIKVFAQYKTYAIGWGERVLMRSIKSSDSKSELAGAVAQTVFGTAGFGILAKIAYAKINNKKTPSFDPTSREGAANLTEAFLPAGGFWADSLANASQSHSLTKALSPASFSEIDSFYNFLHTMGQHATNNMFDKPKHFRKSGAEVAEHFAFKHIPFMNHLAVTAVNKYWINPPEDKR